jgi:hypothetical protein
MPLDFGQDKVCGEIFGEGFEGEGVSIYDLLLTICNLS